MIPVFTRNIFCVSLPCADPAFDFPSFTGSGFLADEDVFVARRIRRFRVCAQCHKEISASQRMTPMARTLSRADGSAVLREHPELGCDHQEHKFRISTANGKSIFL